MPAGLRARNGPRNIYFTSIGMAFGPLVVTTYLSKQVIRIVQLLLGLIAYARSLQGAGCSAPNMHLFLKKQPNKQKNPAVNGHDEHLKTWL